MIATISKLFMKIAKLLEEIELPDCPNDLVVNIRNLVSYANFQFHKSAVLATCKTQYSKT